MKSLTYFSVDVPLPPPPLYFFFECLSYVVYIHLIEFVQCFFVFQIVYSAVSSLFFYGIFYCDYHYYYIFQRKTFFGHFKVALEITDSLDCFSPWNRTRRAAVTSATRPTGEDTKRKTLCGKGYVRQYSNSYYSHSNLSTDDNHDEEDELVRWSFERSQPLGIVSGLRTNFGPSLSYSSRVT